MPSQTATLPSIGFLLGSLVDRAHVRQLIESQKDWQTAEWNLVIANLQKVVEMQIRNIWAALLLCAGANICAPTALIAQNTSALQTRQMVEVGVEAQQAGDYFKAAATFGEACRAGNGNGCKKLSKLHRFGLGVAKNEALAAQLLATSVKLLTDGCNVANGDDCKALADSYGVGDGVRNDRGISEQFETKAARLFDAACNAGDAPSCHNLGDYHYTGSGVAKNRTKAAQLYEKGCRGGTKVACFSLGNMYEKGVDIGKDDRRAVALYTEACNGGYRYGCNSLKKLNAAVSVAAMKPPKIEKPSLVAAGDKRCFSFTDTTRTSDPPAKTINSLNSLREAMREGDRDRSFTIVQTTIRFTCPAKPGFTHVFAEFEAGLTQNGMCRPIFYKHDQSGYVKVNFVFQPREYDNLTSVTFPDRVDCISKFRKIEYNNDMWKQQ